MKQAITLTDNAASRIKDIMANDETKSLELEWALNLVVVLECRT